MTREEYDTRFTPSPDEYQKCSCGNQIYDHIRILMYLNSLEKTIKDLELEAPKSCDKCKWYNPETYMEHHYCKEPSGRCSLWNYIDYYEPKEK